MPPLTVTVQPTGTGTGTISSQPAGIDCGTDCTESYQSGTDIQLTVTPNGDSTFAGWSGDVNCSDSFTITDNMDCTATFIPLLPPPMFLLNVQKAGTGSGLVSSEPTGIDCGTDCTEIYLSGTTVTLTATPKANSIFTNWTGACTGAEASTTVTLDTVKDCTAHFALKHDTLTVTKMGNGMVTSQPAGINCGDSCTADYPTGTLVTLVAAPHFDSRFIGFTGDDDCTDGQVALNTAMLCNDCRTF